MASRRPGPGELVAGASGLVLLLAMFLPWYGVDSSARLPGTERVVTVSGGDVNAWEAFAGIDLVLAIAAALAIAVLLVGLEREPPAGLALAAVAGAMAAALLIVLRLIDAPEIAIDRAADTAYDIGRRLGAFLALLSTAGIAWGAGALVTARAVEPAEVEPAVAEPAAPAVPAKPTGPREPAEAGASPEPAPPEPAPAPPARAPVDPAPALAAGPLGGWTRADVDAECESAWRRYDRRLGARYARYFEDHPDLVGEQRTSARDLGAALPSGWGDLADAVPADAWKRQHLSGKSSQTLAVGLLGVAARRDPSLTWLWQALEPLPPPDAEEPAIEFEHVVDPSLLGERPRQTSFDVLVDDPNVLIGIETKWRERGVGACLCRGEGAGPLAGSRCSRRVEQRAPYWDAAATVLGLASREPGDACPISPVYEVVRHAAALTGLAGPDRPAALALLYDAHNPYFASVDEWPGWPDLLREAVEQHADPDQIRLVAISWQDLVALLPLDEPTRAWAADKHGLD
jgi:hypothetical protein